LFVASDVGGAGKAGQIDEGGAADVVGNGLEGELQSVAEEAIQRQISWGVGEGSGEEVHT
jgi:hypothetical protein